MVRPACQADTKVGITSAAFVAGHLVAATAEVALLSLGVNDHGPIIDSAEHLVRLRESVAARRVY